MAVLSSAHRAIVQSTIDFMAGNYEKPLDANVIDQLVKVFDNKAGTGFRCACGSKGPTLKDSLRDAPFSTLLTLLLAVSDAGTGPGTF
jgi:hypothetical protein